MFKPSVQSSVASEFTNQKFAKTLSTFSCPYLISHSVILLIPPPHFQYIFFQTLVYGLLQKYLWEHVPTLLYILLLSCSKHTSSLGAHMPACIRVPRKSSSKELHPVSYIVGWGPSEEMYGKPIQLGGDTFYMSPTLNYQGHALYSVTSY